jgi:hypothetical protein
MRNIVINTKNILIILILASIAGVGIWFLLKSTTNPTTSNQPRKNLDSANNMKKDASIPQLKSIQPHHTIELKTKSQKIVGTWVKYYTNTEGARYKADDKLHLSVAFDHNGRFLWDCKQYGNDGQIIDESLTGTYSFERGFLITYKFDKPSPSAQKSLPKFFAFWPNQMKGQQTFRFHDDTLILGHDGNKMWFYLRRKSNAEHITKQNNSEKHHIRLTQTL